MDNTRKGFKLTPTDKDKRIADLEAQIAELKEKSEITELALDNCLKESEVEK